MPNLEELFRQTFEDKVFTRKERQALSKILKEEKLDEQELSVLRAKVFDMVSEDWREHEDQMILNWLYAASKLLLPANESVRTEVFFSPGEACRSAIIKGFRSARHTADVCVFTISDNVITKEILHCHRRGVRVRIITDNDKIHDRGSDIFQMAEAGIPTKIDSTDYHMHHKFAIFDKDT
ncbi:MAG: phospholipase D-like domain-containing protein, partial [Bacteroidota bacterium]